MNHHHTACAVYVYTLLCGAVALFSYYLTFQVLHTTSMSSPQDIHYADSIATCLCVCVHVLIEIHLCFWVKQHNSSLSEHIAGHSHQC